MTVALDNDVFEFKATITNERYYNEDSSWGVYVFSTEDEIPYLKNAVDKLNNENLCVSTLCGKVQKLYLGSEYKIKAKVEYNNKYSSYQYNPISVIAQTPKSDKDKLLFLETLIRHDIAIQLLEQYPSIIEDVIGGKIKKECFDTSTIKGMGAYTFNRLYDNIIDNYVLSDIITMLQPIGVSYAMIKKLISNEPNPSLLKQKLEDNPYIITNIRGIGFKKADDLALKLKPEFRKSIYRLTSFIQYYLRERGDNDGHTWISIDELKNSVANDIPECFELLPQLLKSNTFLYSNDINGNEHIGLKYMYDIEMNIADILIDKINTEIDKFNFSEEDINKAIETAEKEQGFKYTEEQCNIIFDALRSNVAIISGKAGCVDCETEFFNGHEWKKISEYKKDDKVLQYNIDGSAELVKPKDFIKQKTNELYHFETKYGLDQCLSKNHNVVYMSVKGHFHKEPFENIIKKQESTGFYGRFITSFNYNGNGINLTDDEIRLCIAVFADGRFEKCNLNKNSRVYGQVRMHLKKERKKERLEKILNCLKLKYKKVESSEKGYYDYYFKSPLATKHYPNNWYNCSKHQFQVIADEVMLWDGDFKQRNNFSTTNKEDADFIQFVYSSLGYRSAIYTQDRTGKDYLTCGKIYQRKNVEYTVSYTKRNLVGMCADNRLDHTKTMIVPYKPKDGYEYCFTVSSGMLVLRRNNKIFITGNSGKTTISRAILQAYKDKSMSITCVALSAKAAQRISEASSLPASTIHRALVAEGLDKFHYNHDNPLVTDVVYLDEASMVNARVFYDLLSAIGESTRIIISGDYLQLPPIGYGNIFADTLNNEQSFKSYQLKKVMRQAEKSGILSDANKIREGINPISKPELKIVHGELQDMFYMFRDNREALNNIAIKTFISSIEKDGIDNVVIVTPRRKDCLNSSFEINKKIQEMLLGKEKKYIDKKYIKFYKGAKVIQNVNNYEKKIFNGEMGYIKDISTKSVDDSEIKITYVEFDDAATGKKKTVEYAENEISQLDLAYALTCHKIQGSGFKTVIGIIDNTHYALLDSCMLYTMLTRAKQRCLLLAEPSAFIKCIHTNKNVTRKTWLRDLKHLKTN